VQNFKCVASSGSYSGSLDFSRLLKVGHVAMTSSTWGGNLSWVG